jgi:hypothetical protein
VDLPRCEGELHEANLLLADPNHYSDAFLVMDTVERKKGLEERVAALTAEWEEVFRRLEEIRGEFEQQREHATVNEQ